tara:strand:- start:300 stop:1952 length:1653 start_codon:yes stop_codon:yes gene_type:complete
MASLNGQTIASSYEQLLHTDTDGGGNGNTLVTIKDGDNGTIFGLKLATNKVEVIPSAADDANAFEVSKNDGTAVFTVDTSTPGATLVSDEENILRLDGLQGNIDFRYGSDIEFDRAGQVYITANNASGELNFRTGGQNIAMHIDNSQNVGIGETSPLGNLHVKSADSGASAHASADEIVAEGSANSGVSILSGTSGEGAVYFGNSGDNDIGRIRYNHSSNSMDFKTNASVAMTIDSSQRVGIGTTSPAYTLDLASSDAIVSQFTGSSGETILSLDNTSTNGDKWYLISGGSGGSFSGGKFGIYNADTTTAVATFTNDGNLGIGDTSPSTALTTFGSASRGLSIKNVQPTIALTDTDTGSGHFWITNTGGQSYFQNNVSGSIFRFLTSDGEKLRILNGGGITFNGDTATANALDDYEEGTYTINITGTTADGWTNKAGYATAQYVKIGSLVTVTARYETQSADAGRTGTLRYNLPFTVADLTDQAGGAAGSVTVNRSGFALTRQLTAITFDNVAYFNVQIANESGATESYIQASDIDGTFEGHFSITYRTA